MLLLRLAVRLHLTWRLVRAARPIREPWTAVRMCASAMSSAAPSPSVRPLLPPHYADWDLPKRQGRAGP